MKNSALLGIVSAVLLSGCADGDDLENKPGYKCEKQLRVLDQFMMEHMLKEQFIVRFNQDLAFQGVRQSHVYDLAYAITEFEDGRFYPSVENAIMSDNEESRNFLMRVGWIILTMDSDTDGILTLNEYKKTEDKYTKIWSAQ